MFVKENEDMDEDMMSTIGYISHVLQYITTGCSRVISSIWSEMLRVEIYAFLRHKRGHRRQTMPSNCLCCQALETDVGNQV